MQMYAAFGPAWQAGSSLPVLKCDGWGLHVSPMGELIVGQMGSQCEEGHEIVKSYGLDTPPNPVRIGARQMVASRDKHRRTRREEILDAAGGAILPDCV